MKPYHHGDLKRTLLELALEELERVGLERLSLRALAQTAGVSKNAPYRHFSDKEALLREVAAEGFTLLADALEYREIRLEPPRKNLRAVMEAYVGFARRHPQLYRLMFSPLGYSLHSDRCLINAQRAMSVLIKSVAESQSSGWRAGTDPVHLVLSFWGLGHGWAGLLNDNLLPDDIGFDHESWIDSAMALL